MTTNKLLIISTVVLILCGLTKITFSEGNYFIPASIGSSAQMIRQGNIEGLTNLSSNLFENPASLHLTKKSSIALFTTKIMNEVDYKNIAISSKLSFGTIGLGIMTLGVGGIPFTKQIVFDSDNPDGFDVASVREFSYNNTMGKLSFQTSQNKIFHIGTSLSYFKTDLDTYIGEGFNLDIGCLFTFKNWIISIVGKNIIPSLKANWNNKKSEEIAKELVYSTKYSFSEIDILGQAKTIGKSRKYLLSYAINYSPSFFNIFHISAGSKDLLILNNIKNNKTLGIGLDLFGVTFDYAYEQSDHIEYNSKHYFSLGLTY